jgi:hypothetical protein
MTVRIWPLLVLAMTMSACAASQRKLPVAVAASPAASIAQTPAVPNYDTAELDRRARQKGYHVVIFSGERRYCQYGAPVGSHISQMHCLNAELMTQAVREDDELQNKLSLRGNQLCPSCTQRNN